MRRDGDLRTEWCQRTLILTLLFALLPTFGLAGDPSSSKNGAGASKSGGNAGLEAFYVLLGILAVVLLGFFLFKMWQKKKREEQHARLLRLFEEDDELELELGLKD